MGRKRIYTAKGNVRVTAQQQQAISRRRQEVGGTWADAVRHSLDLLCREQQQADELKKHLAALGVMDPGDATPEERRNASAVLQSRQLSGEMLSLMGKLGLMDQRVHRSQNLRFRLKALQSKTFKV